MTRDSVIDQIPEVLLSFMCQYAEKSRVRALTSDATKIQFGFTAASTSIGQKQHPERPRPPRTWASTLHPPTPPTQRPELEPTSGVIIKGKGRPGNRERKKPNSRKTKV